MIKYHHCQAEKLRCFPRANESLKVFEHENDIIGSTFLNVSLTAKKLTMLFLDLGIPIGKYVNYLLLCNQQSPNLLVVV